MAWAQKALMRSPRHSCLLLWHLPSYPGHSAPCEVNRQAWTCRYLDDPKDACCEKLIWFFLFASLPLPAPHHHPRPLCSRLSCPQHSVHGTEFGLAAVCHLSAGLYIKLVAFEQYPSEYNLRGSLENLDRIDFHEMTMKRIGLMI